MDIKTVLATVPWLRRAWRYTPAPLRIPLLITAIGIAVWYVATGRHRDEGQAGPGPA